MKTLKFVFALFVFFQLECSKSEEIEYELTVNSPGYNYNITNHSQEVVTSTENAISIKILNDFPLLRKGMLDISPDTLKFWMTRRNLERIEPGVFDDQNITNEISLQSNKLRVISTGTFKNLRIKKLDLSYNQITHFEKGAISDLPNLWELYLTYNEIVEFDGKAIVNTPSMWNFVLTLNKIEKLEKKSFSFMKKDEGVIVALGYNKIKEIHPGAFEGINVYNLDLKYNNLKKIPNEVFTGNGFAYLKLENNQLEDLPKAFFDMKQLRDLDIEDNPLKCGFLKKLLKFSEEVRFSLSYDVQNCS